MSSSSSSPCAACKFLRRKCTYDCVFAPYFPAENQARFAQVHRVFGAGNVTKLLNELSPEQREEAVNTLAYEAEARLRDPVYGCVGYIALLQQRLLELQRDLSAAKRELYACAGPAAAGPLGIYDQFYAAGAAHGREVAGAQQLEEVVEMARLWGEVGCVGVSAAAAAAAEEVEVSPPPPEIGGYEDLGFREMEKQREEELRLRQRRSFDDGGDGGAGPSC